MSGVRSHFVCVGLTDALTFVYSPLVLTTSATIIKIITTAPIRNRTIITPHLLIDWLTRQTNYSTRGFRAFWFVSRGRKLHYYSRYSAYCRPRSHLLMCQFRIMCPATPYFTRHPYSAKVLSNIAPYYDWLCISWYSLKLRPIVALSAFIWMSLM